MDESRRRPPVSGFQCGERVDQQDDGTALVVMFHCNLSQSNMMNRLEFCCREPSCGALLQDEERATFDQDNQEIVDPNFFDEGYTLAGRTGFQVWTGSRILMEALCWPQEEHDCKRLRELQERIANGANVLEFGAGVGVVGTYLAAMGANVLLTDLPTLVEEAIYANLERNRNESRITDETNECPAWLQPHAIPVGKAWVNTVSLDWKKPLDIQLSKQHIDAVDLLVASDCVFLVDMLNSLLDTVTAVFEQSTKDPSFILSFQRRDAKEGDDSTSFTTVNRVLAEVKARGWTIGCLAWRPVTVGEDTSEVFVFEIKQERGDTR